MANKIERTKRPKGRYIKHREKKQPRAEPPIPGMRFAPLLIPVVMETPGYVSPHIDVRLTVDQATALRRLADGLDRVKAKLPNGRRVTNTHDAARWLLQRLAETIEGVAGVGQIKPATGKTITAIVFPPLNPAAILPHSSKNGTASYE